jgi:hypothetical protein
MDPSGSGVPRGTGAVAMCYGLTGVLTAVWGATVAATDARLALGPGRLGGALLALAVGSLVAMLVAGRLADRWTGRWLLRLTLPTAALALTGPALAPTAALLALSAFVLGTQLGALNVALTVQAVAVEQAAGRPVIARMHGIWALGAVAGGTAVSAALRAGLDVRAVMAAGGVALAAASLAATPKLPAFAPAPRSALSPAPGGAIGRLLGLAGVVALGVVGAAAFLSEGAATDWAGVHAVRVLGAGPATASMVYAVFFAAMTVVRFAGDAVRGRLGAPVTLRVAGATATAGYGLVLVSGGVPAATPVRVTCATAGWALTGAGMAVVWPVVVSAVGAAGGGGAGGRLSAVTTVSYSGGLVGPALIGGVAARATLPVALLVPAGLALLVTLVAPAVLKASGMPGGGRASAPPGGVGATRRARHAVRAATRARRHEALGRNSGRSTVMSKVLVSLSVSVDGYITGRDLAGRGTPKRGSHEIKTKWPVVGDERIAMKGARK